MRLSNKGGNYNPAGNRGERPPAEKTEGLSMRCSPMLKARVLLTAQKKHLKLGELMEEALTQYLEREEGGGPAGLLDALGNEIREGDVLGRGGTVKKERL